jgi:hypothetical protein
MPVQLLDLGQQPAAQHGVHALLEPRPQHVERHVHPQHQRRHAAAASARGSSQVVVVAIVAVSRNPTTSNTATTSVITAVIGAVGNFVWSSSSITASSLTRFFSSRSRG